ALIVTLPPPVVILPVCTAPATSVPPRKVPDVIVPLELATTTGVGVVFGFAVLIVTFPVPAAPPPVVMLPSVTVSGVAMLDAAPATTVTSPLLPGVAAVTPLDVIAAGTLTC